MSLTGGATILLPVDVSSDETPPTEPLRMADSVVVLGYYPVPDQAVPAQVKADYERDAQRRLDAVADGLGDAVTRRLVFTHDRSETIDRVAADHDCDAIFVSGSYDGTDRLFVPLRGDENLDRILSLTAQLLDPGAASVTLFHAAEPSGREQGETLLADAADRLAAAGVDPDRITTQLSETDDPETALIDAAGEFDLLVFGETKPSLTERILGRVPTRLAAEVDRPAFVVRNV